MIRRIIQIDQEKCNGCGACAEACHEGTIAMVEGKAQLMRDDYCDGLGDCLPACPTGAISFVEREAAAYDEQAVLANKQKKMQEKMRKEGTPLPCGCPGSQSRSIRHTETRQAETVCAEPVSRLSQWPVQIKLVPVRAPYFDGAKLLIAADCTAYAYAAFHERFIKGHITLVGCPKLDGVDYAEKLTEMQNIQKDVSTKAKTAETAEKNADTAKAAAQNAQKAAEKSAGNAANSESAAKTSAERAAAARDTAQELAGRVTVDDTLSDASSSPVQNKVIFAALAKKQDVQRVTFVINDTDGGLDAVVAD